MTLEKCTLLVRHLPTNLSSEDIDKMLKTFGAVSVYPMTKNPKMRHMAFAAFDNPAAAQSALQNLHQLELFGRHLIVEYAMNSNFPAAAKSKLSQSSNAKSNDDINQDADKPSKPASQNTSHNMSFIAELIGLNYPFSPKLRYCYPAPSPSIVNNIAKALFDVPKFYWQVLHLMNKMNLPAPFESFVQQHHLRNVNQDFHSEVLDSEEESELESETETTDPVLDLPVSMERMKRTKAPKKVSKKAKIQSMLGHDKAPPDAMVIVPETINPSEVFELPNPQTSKKIEFKISSSNADTKQSSAELDERGSFGTFATTVAVSAETNVDSSQRVEEESGGNFIAEKELRENRMKGEGIKMLPAFKNYEAGTPSDRLYLKNLAKQVEEKDLAYIYGRYVDQTSEEEKSRFNIRLMKEGRMKGQAFITFPSVENARKALADTLGYMLHGKPIIVQFAHTAKAKEA